MANKFSGEGFNPNKFNARSYTPPTSNNLFGELDHSYRHASSPYSYVPSSFDFHDSLLVSDHSFKEADLKRLGASSYVSALVSGGFVKDASNIDFVEENGCVKMSFFNKAEGQDQKSVEVTFPDANNRNKDLQTDFVAGVDQIVFGNNGYKNIASINTSTLPEGTEVLILDGADVSEMCAKFDDEFLNKVAEGSDGKCLILCKNNEKGERKAISSTFFSGDVKIFFDGKEIKAGSGRLLTVSNSTMPTLQPSGQPSTNPSGQPSIQPSEQPSTNPSGQPSIQPSGEPSQPSSQPSGQPSIQPSSQPSAQPTAPTPQPAEKPKWRLSEGEEIGIGLGVFFGAGALLAVGYYCAKKCNEYCSEEDPSKHPAYASAASLFARDAKVVPK